MAISKEKQRGDAKSCPAPKQPAFRLTNLPLKVLSEAERELVSKGSPGGSGRSVASREPLGWCVPVPEEERVPCKELVGSVLVVEPLVTLAVRLFVVDPGAPAATLGTSAPRVSECSVTSSAAGMLLGS